MKRPHSPPYRAFEHLVVHECMTEPAPRKPWDGLEATPGARRSAMAKHVPGRPEAGPQEHVADLDMVGQAKDDLCVVLAQAMDCRRTAVVTVPTGHRERAVASAWRRMDRVDRTSRGTPRRWTMWPRVDQRRQRGSAPQSRRAEG